MELVTITLHSLPDEETEHYWVIRCVLLVRCWKLNNLLAIGQYHGFDLNSFFKRKFVVTTSFIGSSSSMISWMDGLWCFVYYSMRYMVRQRGFRSWVVGGGFSTLHENMVVPLLRCVTWCNVGCTSDVVSGQLWLTNSGGSGRQLPFVYFRAPSEFCSDLKCSRPTRSSPWVPNRLNM